MSRSRFPSSLFDILFGGFQRYRRWRGGRWELVVERYVPPNDEVFVYWAPVSLPTSQSSEPWHECTSAREDWRR